MEKQPTKFISGMDRLIEDLIEEDDYDEEEVILCE